MSKLWHIELARLLIELLTIMNVNTVALAFMGMWLIISSGMCYNECGPPSNTNLLHQSSSLTGSLVPAACSSSLMRLK